MTPVIGPDPSTATDTAWRFIRTNVLTTTEKLYLLALAAEQDEEVTWVIAGSVAMRARGSSSSARTMLRRPVLVPVVIETTAGFRVDTSWR